MPTDADIVRSHSTLMATTEAISKAPVTQLRDLAEHATTTRLRRLARAEAIRRERALYGAIQGYLRLGPVSVTGFHRPKWMPKRVYALMLRSIVVTDMATKGHPATGDQ